jgi:ribosomal protein S16
MAVKIRLKRMGAKKRPFTELLWQTAVLRGMDDLLKKLVSIILFLNPRKLKSIRKKHKNGCQMVLNQLKQFEFYLKNNGILE